MSVYPERRNGRLTGAWIAETTAGGERRRKRFQTQRDGEKWADFTKLTGAPPAEPEAAPVGPTFGSVGREALAAGEASRDPSLVPRLEYATAILGADTPIGDVRTTDFDRLVADLKKRPGRAGRLSAGTINRYLSAASGVLTFAKARAYLTGTPVIPWQEESGKRIHWLTEAAETAVVSHMLQRGWHASALSVRVLTATGLRWGELASLEPGQIDGEWIKLDQTKTNTPRDVPIDPELARNLLALVVRKGLPTYNTFRKHLKAALKSAGQSPALSIHCLRHTTATRLVHKEVNLAVVQSFLGHSSINTTLKYTHVTKSVLKEASEKLSPRAGQFAPLGAVVADPALSVEVQEVPAAQG